MLKPEGRWEFWQPSDKKSGRVLNEDNKLMRLTTGRESYFLRIEPLIEPLPTPHQRLN